MTLHYLHKVTYSTYNINVTYKLTILTCLHYKHFLTVYNILHTLGTRGFFSLWVRQSLAAKASREAARKKPLAPTDNNLTSMPTPIAFD